MSSAVAVPGTKEDSSPLMAEEDWNLEAGEMVEEVIKTQKQVAELLGSHSLATSELEAMKDSCTQELEDLQTDTWKLQLYAELERMRSQLELLAPLASDSSNCTGSLAAAAAAAGSSAPVSACDEPAAEDTAADDSPKLGEAAAEGGCGVFERGELELLELDKEIADISAQLEQARQDMASMMKAKQELERDVGCTSQQMEAKAEDGDLP